jgi:nucleoside 2-deoxyribosyltransferase
MKKIYIAGPDVFRLDAKSWAEDIRALVASFGFEALLPTDNDKTEPLSIYIANCRMIDQCDIIVANVNSFRGVEPDSGTCFEIGFAAALEKQIVIYSRDNDDLKEKVKDSPFGYLGNSQIDINNFRIEDFGFPVNLMLACSSVFVHGNIHDALKYIKDHHV